MDRQGRFSRDAGGLLAALTLAGAVLASPASGCDSSTCALLTRGQNGALAKGAFRVDVAFRYTDQGTKLRGSEPTDDVVLPKVSLEHRFVWPAYQREIGGDESFLQMDVAYGLTSRATVLASAPLRARRSYDISHFGRIQGYGTRGFGDLLLGLRYALGATGMVAGLSLKLPTGDYRVTGDFDGSIPGGVSVYGFLQVPSYRYVHEEQLAPRIAFLTGVTKTF